MTKGLRVARLQVSFAALRDALGLDDDTQIHSIRLADQTHGRCEIIIEHPSLPLVQEGMVMMEVNAVITRDTKWHTHKTEFK